MSTIVTRAGKGIALTWTEMDANFTNLNNDKVEASSPTFTGTVTSPRNYNVSGITGALQVNGVDAVRFGADNSGQLAGFRNKLLNGKMGIAQRGTSVAVASGTVTYLLDRWFAYHASDGAVTVSQQADAPSNNEFQNSLRVAVTTADTAIAAGQNASIDQRIEGYNARDLIGRTFTISFWVRSSKTGIHCVALRNGGDRCYIAEYSINTANTWEYKTLTVVGGLPTAGTWNWTNGSGLDVAFVLASGSNFYTTAGAWKTGSYIATSKQVNCLDTIGNVFAITGVQLEVGSIATPFEHRPYSLELALCQRYYQNIGNGLVGNTEGTTSAAVMEKFITVMRATPTLAVRSGYSCVLRYAGTDLSTASPTISAASSSTPEAAWFIVGGFSSLTSNYTLVSRNNSDSSLFISATAEL